MNSPLRFLLQKYNRIFNPSSMSTPQDVTFVFTSFSSHFTRLLFIIFPFLFLSISQFTFITFFLNLIWFVSGIILKPCLMLIFPLTE
ncbi:hypothetical protein Fmac_020877 [Flemingia macrophylla]|uniref:Uncharacterized protein n=1 Tax=Flemingia macrophylla TaxID=520843 RepID=A0ABD1LV76_9FABA